MKTREFPAIGERRTEFLLENGLRVRVIPKEGFARFYAFLAVDFGSIDTSFVQNGRHITVPDGIAHYLEHKMFDLPGGENAMDQFARLGGIPNAFTSFDMTAYHVVCTDHFEENLRVLLHMVTTPYFTDESVEKERGIIAQEIKMYTDNPLSRVGEELFAACFAHNPVRVPIAGSVESIEKITAQMLYDCYGAFYTPENMILCVAGDVDAERVAQIAREECVSAPKPLPERDYGPAESGYPAKSHVTLEMEVSMPTFALGFACTPPEKRPDSARREIVGDLASDILIGESSALFQRLYEQGLVDGTLAAGYEYIKDACLLSVSGDSKDPQAVAEAILQEAERIDREGFDLELFRRLKKSALGRRTRDLDSLQGICYRTCALEFDSVDYFDFPALFADIQPEEVAAFLRQTVRREKACLTVVEPKHKEMNHDA